MKYGNRTNLFAASAALICTTGLGCARPLDRDPAPINYRLPNATVNVQRPDAKWLDANDLITSAIRAIQSDHPAANFDPSDFEAQLWVPASDSDTPLQATFTRGLGEPAYDAIFSPDGTVATTSAGHATEGNGS